MGATRFVDWGRAAGRPPRCLEITADPVALDIATAHMALGGAVVGMRGGRAHVLLKDDRTFGVSEYWIGYDWHLVVSDSWSAQPPVQKGE
ncbi:hypothetical protein [Burkholderia cenocepacia]|uniref:hypothetical protein n=1 Tax=Burkholderia cenocepacia TaxID=95486 RepID=UPI002653892E|nr:hypothetical protein [Burkholderia cenocepacia]MDN7537048.1 hypothetical protein [Burkholderia cenocepacia]